ncbi:MAG: cell division protein SepF [Ruminococcus sp.]|nr:cell division protein SepF [Ruminococcus sp.]MBP8593003.1 cell division protein SepF [Ruminococcus sp.]MBQ3855594.1 cell division protein SepF [Ruminococcus sp.]HBB20378.1 cell division protein SepF [Ruminococcus sp.]HOO06165.1 cell division protein SepF [Ruminococcus sp.]
MKLFENIKEFFFAAEDEDGDLNDAPVRGDHMDRPTYDRSDREEPVAEGNPTGRRNKVVNIQTTAQLQVVLVKPSAFTDAKQIADHLIAKKTVVLNLETASPENKRRIIDFLVGVAYANGGSLKPVANLTYIITPYNVGFIGEDLVGELENNGVFI